MFDQDEEELGGCAISQAPCHPCCCLHSSQEVLQALSRDGEEVGTWYLSHTAAYDNPKQAKHRSRTDRVVALKQVAHCFQAHIPAAILILGSVHNVCRSKTLCAHSKDSEASIRAAPGISTQISSASVIPMSIAVCFVWLKCFFD